MARGGSMRVNVTCCASLWPRGSCSKWLWPTIVCGHWVRAKFVQLQPLHAL